MKFLHVFAMIIILAMSSSVLYGDSHLGAGSTNGNNESTNEGAGSTNGNNTLTLEDIMTLINEGSMYFGNNNDESNYAQAINLYEEAINALRVNKQYGESQYPIVSSDEGYVHGVVSASYKRSVFQELTYFLSLNIGKSYVGLCQIVNANNSQNEYCEMAIPYLKTAKVLLSKSKYKYNKYTDADYNLGLSYILINEYNQAKKVLRKALKINDKNDNLYGILAVRHGQYTRERDFDREQIKPTLRDAKKLLEKALTIAPEKYKYMNNLGEINSRLTYYNDAIKHYGEAIFNNPVDSKLYHNRALTYVALYHVRKNKQKYAKLACRDFETAINLNPLPIIENDYDKFRLEEACP